jgi:hypothetical protein
MFRRNLLSFSSGYHAEEEEEEEEEESIFIRNADTFLLNYTA